MGPLCTPRCVNIASGTTLLLVQRTDWSYRGSSLPTIVLEKADVYGAKEHREVLFHTPAKPKS